MDKVSKEVIHPEKYITRDELDGSVGKGAFPIS